MLCQIINNDNNNDKNNNKIYDETYNETYNIDEFNKNYNIDNIQEIQEPILKTNNYTIIKYIYNYICDPKYKNEQYKSIIYCKKCDKIYDVSYKIIYKWCDIPYYYEIIQIEYNSKNN